MIKSELLCIVDANSNKSESIFFAFIETMLMQKRHNIKSQYVALSWCITTAKQIWNNS